MPIVCEASCATLGWKNRLLLQSKHYLVKAQYSFTTYIKISLLIQIDPGKEKITEVKDTMCLEKEIIRMQNSRKQIKSNDKFKYRALSDNMRNERNRSIANLNLGVWNIGTAK